MNKLYLLLFLFGTLWACKKGLTPEELQNQKLAGMRKNIVNNWKVSKMMVVKPASQYGREVFSFPCNVNDVYSFRSDGTFAFIGNPDCSYKTPLPGKWKLPQPDSLYIEFTGTIRLAWVEKLEVTELTSRTMKWNIIAANGNGMPDDTVEYTLVPR